MVVKKSDAGCFLRKVRKRVKVTVTMAEILYCLRHNLYFFLSTHATSLSQLTRTPDRDT
jgi:hypothetical protein